MKEPFDLFRDFINTVETTVQELAKENNIEHLGGPQGHTVSYLFKNQDKEIFIKDIEERLHISKSVASNLIKRMEKNGFISIIPSQKDKRCKQIILTPLGLNKAGDIITFHKKIHEQLLKGIDKADLVTARRVFEQIKQNLEK
ncbi:MarR family winged helix-turn-helix transcriptional regulator [Streptococcus ratti]|uniref:MarR family transcriptional regulator n=1 Tax=Streptococcus ratti FA-1 = DSM 20564 TaxID=699248 RepID=A0ABP2QY65_STRRT|nr:MarR family winged helix-turn-helix transcriptional regulator [Streptococcus ratti]EJN93779.1 MarR family transcriptional regulator [Streptococcus ratti FA-1 = DSM 20564]EMP70727.1 MarR family transcriptional regulator [Streptococcus ratti FA-1 = DSM 20564]QEY07632.1 winged helix-turn-helix transcriptional regulator [Streptococcus ratti]VEI60092.1 MarR family transcriptional regulator [Streptococcus mutans]